MRFHPEAAMDCGEPQSVTKNYARQRSLSGGWKKFSFVCLPLTISPCPEHSHSVARNRQNQGAIFGQGSNGPALAKRDVRVCILVWGGSEGPPCLHPLPSFSEHQTHPPKTAFLHKGMCSVCGQKQHPTTAGVASPMCSGPWMRTIHHSCWSSRNPLAGGRGRVWWWREPPSLPWPRSWMLTSGRDIKGTILSGWKNPAEFYAPLFYDTKQVAFASRATAPGWGAAWLLMRCFSFGSAGQLLGAPEHKMWSKCWAEGIISLPTRALRKGEASHAKLEPEGDPF